MHISLLTWMCSSGCWFNSCKHVYLPSSQKHVLNYGDLLEVPFRRGISAQWIEFINLFA